MPLLFLIAAIQHSTIRSPEVPGMLLRHLSFALLVLLGTTLMAQVHQRPGARVYGLNDLDVPTPMHSLETASDPAAVQSIIDFVRMSGVSGWKGMSPTGTMTFFRSSYLVPTPGSIHAGRTLYVAAFGSTHLFKFLVRAPKMRANTYLSIGAPIQHFIPEYFQL